MDTEDRKILLRLKFSVAILFFVVTSGTIGFWLLEDKVTTILDSFFFTLVTVTTIGYGNITPQTSAGKILDIAVILLGVGAALVSIQTVFEAIIRSKIQEVLKVPKGIANKKGHFIICGYGKIGKPLVKGLRQKNAQFVIIENDASRVKEMVRSGLLVVEGDARKEDVLERADIKTAKFVLTSLDDSSNVFVTLTAKMLNPSVNVICKIEDITNEAKLKKAGANEVISCHDMGAKMMIKVAQGE